MVTFIRSKPSRVSFSPNFLQPDIPIGQEDQFRVGSRCEWGHGNTRIAQYENIEKPNRSGPSGMPIQVTDDFSRKPVPTLIFRLLILF